MSLKERFRIDHHCMVIDMNDAKLVTIEQLRSWLAGNLRCDINLRDQG